MLIIRVIKKFKTILSRHQKFRVIELAILMVFAGFLEMLSVSLVMPFMKFVLEPDEIMKQSYVIFLCDVLGIHSSRTFLVLISVFIAILYIFKNVFLLLQMLVQNRFVFNNRFYTQRGLLHYYLMRPYEFFLDVKSGDVLQVINRDTETVFYLLSNLLFLFSESVVSGALIMAVFFMSPGITAAVAMLMAAVVCVLQVFVRPLLKRIGNENRKANAGAQQWLIQAINGIKDIKVKQSEKYFEKKYNDYGTVAVRTTYISNTLGLVPRFMIESVSMASFFFVIAFMIGYGKSIDNLIPILSAVAMAAVRLLPAINRISNSLVAIAFSEPALDKICDILSNNIDSQDIPCCESDKADPQTKRINCFHNNIEMIHVNYRYPTGKNNVLEDFCISIKRGQSIGIIGASGAGKTTVVDVMLGLLVPDSGTVCVDGVNIQDDLPGWLNRIGYISQSIFMLDGTVRDNIVFGTVDYPVDDERVWKALREASLDQFVLSLPNGLDTEIGERGLRLSGGQRQRIGIARALYADPEVLLFDEATSALDNETEKVIMESINCLAGTKTMIIIAHRLSTIEKCDVIYRVKNGVAVKEK